MLPWASAPKSKGGTHRKTRTFGWSLSYRPASLTSAESELVGITVEENTTGHVDEKYTQRKRWCGSWGGMSWHNLLNSATGQPACRQASSSWYNVLCCLFIYLF